jgi:hypothetical protein
MPIRLLTLALALVASVIVHPAAAHAATSVPHYLMTAFTNSSESNLYVYDSSDATGYSVVRANAYTPPSGLIRDPSVLRHTDGYYYLVYTTGWTGNTIGFARSADYVQWTFLRNVTVGLNGATGSTWAPEWFRDTDGSVHVIFSASATGTAGQFQPYRITATDGSLSTWSARVPLGVAGNHIDSFLVKVNGTYHNFVKNETTKYIEHLTATSPTGPWQSAGTGDWAGWGSGLEGPALVRLPDGRWRIYFDNYTAGRYYYADSGDLSTFGARTQLAGLSGTARHFTVLRQDVGDGTTVATGNVSLRSVNFPDRYVRHRDSLGRIDPLTAAGPLADRQDATFRAVPGLAVASCRSFESVNFPGRYLRHYDMRLVLAQNDNSTIFRRDATFCPRTGLAGGSSVSFEPYNQPGRFLRHADYQLRVDLRAATTVFAGDASFTVTAPLSS